MSFDQAQPTREVNYFFMAIALRQHEPFLSQLLLWLWCALGQKARQEKFSFNRTCNLMPIQNQLSTHTKLKEKAADIQAILNDLYLETPIPLKHEDSYTLLVAVLLSAQCTDEQVNQISPTLFARLTILPIWPKCQWMRSGNHKTLWLIPAKSKQSATCPKSLWTNDGKVPEEVLRN